MYYKYTLLLGAAAHPAAPQTPAPAGYGGGLYLLQAPRQYYVPPCNSKLEPGDCGHFIILGGHSTRGVLWDARALPAAQTSRSASRVPFLETH